IESNLGQRDRARNWARNALKASRRAGDDLLESGSRRRLGWLDYYDAELDRAGEHARRSYELAERAGADFQRVKALRLRAAIEKARGTGRAGELFERTWHEAAEAGYLYVEAQALNGLGEYARFSGQLDDARDYYAGYLRKIRQLSRDIERVIGTLNLAQIDLRAGDLERAREQLESAEEILEAIDSPDREHDLRHLIRLTYFAGVADREQFASAWEALAEGWPEDWWLTKDAPWLLETAGRYAREAGWTEAARQVWQLGCDLWEQLGDEKEARRLAESVSELPDEAGSSSENTR
ncbi:MAG: hypothetical protein ABEN55_07715, partial [Bradymonadaceae bacterium]